MVGFTPLLIIQIHSFTKQYKTSLSIENLEHLHHMYNSRAYNSYNSIVIHIYSAKPHGIYFLVSILRIRAHIHKIKFLFPMDSSCLILWGLHYNTTLL